MDEIQKLTEQIEYLFLKQIVKGLLDETITPEQAKEYAQAFLPIEPFTSIDEAKEKIHGFTATHIQFKNLQEYIDAFHEDQQTDRKIAEMKTLIQNNNIEEAINVAKG